MQGNRTKLSFKQLRYSIRPTMGAIAGAAFAATIGFAGCGGGSTSEFGGQQSSSLNGDLSSGYNGGLGTRRGTTNGSGGALSRGAYPVIETSFDLPSIKGDPFDYEKVSVQVTLKKADGGNALIPAFFDAALRGECVILLWLLGNTTWLIYG